MNRQAIFDTFVNKCNNKGQAIDKFSGACMYVVPNHPGCAIGCQPQIQEIRDKVKKWQNSYGEGNIYDLLSEFPSLEQAFDIKNEDDKTFLSDLQQLHDSGNNWKIQTLKSNSIRFFAEKYNLNVPESNYA